MRMRLLIIRIRVRIDLCYRFYLFWKHGHHRPYYEDVHKDCLNHKKSFDCNKPLADKMMPWKIAHSCFKFTLLWLLLLLEAQGVVVIAPWNFRTKVQARGLVSASSAGSCLSLRQETLLRVVSLEWLPPTHAWDNPLQRTSIPPTRK